MRIRRINGTWEIILKNNEEPFKMIAFEEELLILE